MTAMTYETTLHFGGVAWSIPRPLPILQSTAESSGTSASIARALESPIGLPSLDQIVVPGDVVALAVDAATPDLPRVVSGVVGWLREKGTSAENLKVVLASNSTALQREVVDQMTHDGLAEVEVQLHDPDVAEAVAYVAANDQSDPIYINRTLVDADVVLPIVCVQRSTALDYVGSYSIFPWLSNRQTRGHFFSLPRLDVANEHQKLKSWADEAAWWLGILAAVNVVPADGQQVGAVLAGLTEPLAEASQREYERLWTEAKASSHFVIALLDGSPAQQTWHAVARALRAAARFTAPGGSIALCTQLHESVCQGLQRLSDVHHDRDQIATKLSKDTGDNALPAAVILQVTSDHHVYLASELRAASVESLGVAVLENEAQLAHLIQQHEDAVVLRSAQHW
ncbi:MAG: lactate racemase domain-containing protein [Pirellulaceae bacterium]